MDLEFAVYHCIYSNYSGGTVIIRMIEKKYQEKYQRFIKGVYKESKYK